MARKSFPLSQVYRLLEPGPVVMVTTARKGRADVMTMSWHTMLDFEPPIVGCVVSDRNYSFGVLKATREEVLKAWIDPSRKRPRTIHHLGRGTFTVAGRTIKLPSRIK